jgi:N-ethylmaleimide reductase
MEKLFSTLSIGALEVSHRIVLAAASCQDLADHGGRPRTMSALDYDRRATTGSLIIAEPSPISLQGSGSPSVRGLYQAGHIEEWRKPIDAVHARGGLILAQLWHAGRLAHSSVNREGPVSASDVVAPCKVISADSTFVDAEPPRSLDTAGIEAIIADYRQAALNAHAAGFDGVELDGADGCLPEQFLRDSTNRRCDQFGGSSAGRILFLEEVVQALVDVWEPERIGVRLSPFCLRNEIGSSDSLSLFTDAMSALAEQEIAFIRLARAATDGRTDEDDLVRSPETTALLRAAFPYVLICSGSYTREQVVSAVERRWADAIDFAGAFESDPDLARRLLTSEPPGSSNRRL